jgi:hypothetical protein
MSTFPVAPGEKLGEPVSQYRPIALEVFQDISKHRSEDPFQQMLPEDSYLGVTDDEVGVHQPRDQRVYVKSGDETSTTSSSRASSSSSKSKKEQDLDESEEVDAKIKRPRRTSSSNAVPTYSPPSRPSATLAKSRRRGQSMTSLTGLAGKKEDKIWTISVGGASSQSPFPCFPSSPLSFPC